MAFSIKDRIYNLMSIDMSPTTYIGITSTYSNNTMYDILSSIYEELSEQVKEI
jgi:hypothetical protein